MALFPAYAASSTSDRSTSSTAVDDSTFRFSSFQPPPAAEAKKEPKKADVIILDETPPAKTYEEDDVEILEPKSPSSSSSSHSSSARKRRHKRKEKRKKRRRHRSSSEESEASRSVPAAADSATASSSASSIQKWALIKKTEALQNIFPGTGGDQSQFMFDNRRDIANLQYETVYKAHLAKFVIYSRRCLSNSSSLSTERIDRLFFGGGQQRNGGQVKKPNRYFSSSRRRRIGDVVDERIFKLKPVTQKEDDQQRIVVDSLPEFLPLNNEMIVDGETMIFDPKLQMYRPVAGPTAEHEESGPAGDFVSENKRLNRLMAERPHDIGLVKEFLRLQDRLAVFSSVGGGKEKARQEEGAEGQKRTSDLALLERKLIVLDKAIEKNPTSVDLHLLRLQLGRDCGWDRENRLRDEWRRLEFAHVNDPNVWIGRIQFERGGGEFSKFTVTRQCALYDHCLDRFYAVTRDQLITHPAPQNAEHHFVRFLIAKIVFLFEAGHTEQAIACVQAALEFNFKMNPALRRSLPLIDDRRKFFEPFWDSNQPRIGDVDAIGWAETVKRGSATLTKEPIDKSAGADHEGEDEEEEENEACRRGIGQRDAGLWLELERLRSSKHWLPYRGTDEPEDAQRLVLFDDIVGVLYDLKDEEDVSARFSLCVEALTVCGLNFPPSPIWSNGRWYDEDEAAYRALFDHFQLLPRLRRGAIDFCYSFSTSDHDHDRFLESLCFEAAKLFPNLSQSYAMYFVDAWLYHEAVSLSRKTEISHKDKLKRYKKTGKSVLSSDQWRDRVVCYRAYARGLITLGAFGEAADVAESALNNAAGAADISTNIIDYVSILDLIAIWIECQFSRVDDTTGIMEKLSTWILNVITTAKEAANVSSSTSRILKAKKCLSDRLIEWKTEKSMGEKFLISWIGSIGCFLGHLNAVFNYVLSSGRDFATSRNFYSETRRQILAGNEETWLPIAADTERLWIWELRLIDYHLRSHPSESPRLLFRCLEDALREFPSNAYFLKLYVDNHLRGQRMAKLRRFFDVRHENWSADNTAGSRMNISWIAAIYAEFARYVKLKDDDDDNGIGPPESGRFLNVLTRAVQCCPSSVLLWRLRLQLESYLGERTAAQRAFYLAIRQCPWAKDLYTDAIALLPDEGQSIVDLMVEKGIRVRVPWEELGILRKAVQKEHDHDDNLHLAS